MNLPKSVAVKLTAGLLSAAMMISPALAASGVVTADSGLHVRQSSSADSASLGLLDKGTTVDILSDLGNGWLEISYQASTGYVASDYIEPTTITGKVNAGPLNVRASASTDGAKVGQLPTGTEVEVLSQKDGWYEVVGGNYTGYVSAQYITLDSQSATTTFVKVTNGPLNVRSGPGSSYDKVSSLRTGRVVEVFGQENGWYKIENGYISAEYVCLADASEAVQGDLPVRPDSGGLQVQIRRHRPLRVRLLRFHQVCIQAVRLYPEPHRLRPDGQRHLRCPQRPAARRLGHVQKVRLQRQPGLSCGHLYRQREVCSRLHLLRGRDRQRYEHLLL